MSLMSRIPEEPGVVEGPGAHLLEPAPAAGQDEGSGAPAPHGQAPEQQPSGAQGPVAPSFASHADAQAQQRAHQGGGRGAVLQTRGKRPREETSAQAAQEAHIGSIRGLHSEHKRLRSENALLRSEKALLRSEVAWLRSVNGSLSIEVEDLKWGGGTSRPQLDVFERPNYDL
eukprot:jgi/Botrbrau1/1126/Bobra.0162s0022.1